MGSTVILAGAGVSIHDKALINLFQRVQRLEPAEREVLTSLLDAFLFRQETK